MTFQTNVLQNREELKRILVEWFLGHLSREELESLGWGRMAGTPAQRYYSINSMNELVSWGERVQASGTSLFVSVSYYAGHNVLAGLERLMIDLDVKPGLSLDDVRREAKSLADALSSYCEPLVIYTGGKGFHIHAWFPSVIDVGGRDVELANIMYRELASMLELPGRAPGSFDYNVVRPTVLSRPPFTVRENGNMVQPLDRDMRPISPESFSLKPYMGNPLPHDVVSTALSRAIMKLQARKARARNTRWTRGRRIEWIERVLRKGLPDGRKRFILYVASKYLVNTLGLDEEAAVERLMEFVEASEKRPDYAGDGRIYRSALRCYVRSAKQRGTGPPSLQKIQEKDPELHEILRRVLDND